MHQKKMLHFARDARGLPRINSARRAVLRVLHLLRWCWGLGRHALCLPRMARTIKEFDASSNDRQWWCVGGLQKETFMSWSQLTKYETLWVREMTQKKTGNTLCQTQALHCVADHLVGKHCHEANSKNGHGERTEGVFLLAFLCVFVWYTVLTSRRKRIPVHSSLKTKRGKQTSSFIQRRRNLSRNRI